MYLNQHSLKLLLWSVRLSKSSYFYYLNNRHILLKTHENMDLRRKKIEFIFKKFKGIYGARKIKVELNKYNIIVSTRTVSNDLKFLGLRSCYVKKYKVKSSDHSKNSNCINYLIDVETNKPLTHIATDLTYNSY